MAFPIPNLPTDNLYKFQALSGLFVGMFGLIFMGIQVSQNAKLVSEVQAQIPYDQFLTSLISSENEEGLSQDQKLELRERVIENMRNSSLKNTQAQVNNDTNRERLFPLFIVSLIGFLMSLRGFRLWYERVQKPLDEILQINLEKAKLEASSPQKESPTTK